MELILPVIVGSAVGGFLTLSGVIIQHCFELRKLTLQLREYPSHIIYDKQMEFIKKVLPLFWKLNGYITRIDVWLGESGQKACAEVEEAANNNACVGEFFQVLDEYYLYLPKSFLEEAHNLLSLCWELGRSPTPDGAYHSIKTLFSFENSVRKLMGVDALSAELLKSFGTGQNQNKQLHDEG